MQGQIQCPNCGSFNTAPDSGEGFAADFLRGAENSLRLLTGKGVDFQNPKYVQRFRALGIGAVCRTCGLRFDANTVVARPASGKPLMPAQHGSQPPTTADRLHELEQLRSAGAVTEEEYRSKRAEILRDL